jgi:AraC family transcriptional regulator, arabinose operon regulatory protein
MAFEGSQAQKDAQLIADGAKRGDYYFLKLNPDPGCELAVVCGGRELCDGSYLVDRPGFRYHSLEFVASGYGSLQLGGKRAALEPGTVFCYGPGIAHRIEAAKGQPMLKYFVDFSGASATNLVRKAFSDGKPWAVSSSSWIQRLFEEMKAAADGLGESRDEVCSLILRQILAMLADRSLYGAPESLEGSLRFRTLKDRLRELALLGYDVERAARACGISTSYLSRLFRRFDHESPKRYLLRCRMAFAASLLFFSVTKLVKTQARFFFPAYLHYHADYIISRP